MIDECLVVEFVVTGDDCPLAEASGTVGTSIDCGAPQRRTDGNVLLRFSAIERVGRLVETLDDDDRLRYLHVAESDDRTNFRCLSKHPCVVSELTDVGFMVESLQYRDGTGAFTGAVVGHDVLRGVLDRAGETVGVTLERVHPLGSDDEGAIARRWNLTPAQEEAIRAALAAGYFEVPKRSTAADVADDLGISKSAFLERLRRGQGSLLEQLLD